MAKQLAQLTRLDPTESLLQYVLDTKPFHTKVLEVMVEYVLYDNISVLVRDSHTSEILMEDYPQGERPPIVHNGGFGTEWDNFSTALIASTVIDSPNVVVTETRYHIEVGDVVMLHTTTSALPTAIHEYPDPNNPSTVEITNNLANKRLFVISKVGNVIQLAVSLADAPLIFQQTLDNVKVNVINQTGILSADTPNTFFVQPYRGPSFSIDVRSSVFNQFMFVNKYSITGIDHANRRITVASTNVDFGQPDESLPFYDPLTLSGIFYVRHNQEQTANKTYNIVSITVDGSGTTFEVEQFIPLSATVTGSVCMPVRATALPSWSEGTAVITTNNPAADQAEPILPPPPSVYFSPLSELGVFRLVSNRFSTRDEDIVDVETVDAELLTVQKTEPFVPGEGVIVTGLPASNGGYTLINIFPMLSSYMLTVNQQVPVAVPAVGNTVQGKMTGTGTYGSPYRPPISAPSSHTDTVITERLVFDWGDDPETPIDDDPPPFDVSPLS